jgi:hypothetical protein
MANIVDWGQYHFHSILFCFVRNTNKKISATAVNFPHTERLARVVQADFKSLKNWFDTHPEVNNGTEACLHTRNVSFFVQYTLILFSDHGVDEYDITGYKMHGSTEVSARFAFQLCLCVYSFVIHSSSWLFCLYVT